MTKINPARLAWAPLTLVALAFGAAGAAAQAQAPPPAPTVQQVPTLPPPRVAPRPPTPRPSGTPAVTAAPVTAAPARAPSRPGPPPDSAPRNAFRPTPLPPANAVAQCRDGSFVVAPSDPSACSSHGGVHIVLPHRVNPGPPPARMVTAAPVAIQAQPSAPPAGATMQCKDGTYLTGTPSAGRCDANGGLAAILPASRAAPPPPPRQRRP